MDPELLSLVKQVPQWLGSLIVLFYAYSKWGGKLLPSTVTGVVKQKCECQNIAQITKNSKDIAVIEQRMTSLENSMNKGFKDTKENIDEQRKDIKEIFAEIRDLLKNNKQ